MKKQVRFFVLSMVILYTVFFLFGNGVTSFGQDQNTEDLKDQIKKLQKRVEELESQNNQEKESLVPFQRNRQKWDPFEELSRMQEEMNRMFEDSFSWRGPYANRGLFGSNLFYDENFGFKEENDKYILEFDISSLDQNNIEINVKDQYISLKCESNKEDSTEDNNQYFNSKSYSTFYKSFPLPADADTLSMKTENKDNKLIITLPKKSISSTTSKK